MRTTMGAVLGTFFLLLGVLLASGAAHADMEDDACQRACREEQAACADACGEHEDPMECESACQETADECLRQCL